MKAVKAAGAPPYAITLKITSFGRMNEEWAKKVWKLVTKSIREDFVRHHSDTPDNTTDNNVTGD